MTTSDELDAIRDPSLPDGTRRHTIRALRRPLGPEYRDAVLDALVHALNEQPGVLHTELLETMRHLDAWLLIGVRHGLLVRARLNPGDVQLDEALACFDAELGHVVDLQRLEELLPELADPPGWLKARVRR